MAAALGVATRRVDALTFAFGAGLAGLAGVAVPLYNKINPQHRPGVHRRQLHGRGRRRRREAGRRDLGRAWAGVRQQVPRAAPGNVPVARVRRVGHRQGGGAGADRGVPPVQPVGPVPAEGEDGRCVEPRTDSTAPAATTGRRMRRPTESDASSLRLYRSVADRSSRDAARPGRRLHGCAWRPPVVRRARRCSFFVVIPLLNVARRRRRLQAQPPRQVPLLRHRRPGHRSDLGLHRAPLALPGVVLLPRRVRDGDAPEPPAGRRDVRPEYNNIPQFMFFNNVPRQLPAVLAAVRVVRRSPWSSGIAAAGARRGGVRVLHLPQPRARRLLLDHHAGRRLGRLAAHQPQRNAAGRHQRPDQLLQAPHPDARVDPRPLPAARWPRSCWRTCSAGPITRSRLGRVLVAVRDKETRLYFAGYQPYAFKVFAFAVAAMLAGVGGMLYAAAGRHHHAAEHERRRRRS